MRDVSQLSGALMRLPRTAGAIALEAARDFVWADIKAGLVDLRGLSRVTRGLIVLGFTLTALMISLVIFSDLWRATSELIPRSNSQPGRGTLIPLPLLPSALFLLSMAWSFALTGALHSHWALRLAVLTLFVMVSASWIGKETAILADPLLSYTSVLGVVAFFFIRWRSKAQVGLEFLVLLALVSVAFLIPQIQGIPLWRMTGVPLLVTKMDAHVLSLFAFAVPFLLLNGLGVANFTYSAADWCARTARAHLPTTALYVLLGSVLILRLGNVLEAGITRVVRAPERELWAFLGALGTLACVGAAWGLTWRLLPASTEPPAPQDLLSRAEYVAVPLVVGHSLVQLFNFVAITAVSALISLPFPLSGPDWAGSVTALTDLLNNQFTDLWRLIFYILAVLAGIWQARRNQYALALYLTALGLTATWLELTEVNQPLGQLNWVGPIYTDFWWTLVFTGVAIFWLIRRAFTPERAAGLLLIALISGLLRQTEFLDDRFAPFLGFAGIGFVAFCLAWDVLTIGNWANVSTPGLPRISRIFLYLGYVLFTVTIVHWMLATRNLNLVSFITGDAALFGFDRFGKPILYTLYLIVLTSSRSEHVYGARQES
jgi:hypothetical protein